jgi:integrase
VTDPLWRIPGAADEDAYRAFGAVLTAGRRACLREIDANSTPIRQAGNERLRQSSCFPVASSKTGTISENRMLDVMYRIGLRGKATVHGFRGLASTVLNESGLFASDWIEMQLAHVQRGVRAAYNSARYLTQRRDMMHWWSYYLDEAERKGLSGNHAKT